jgi:hypothetical protein
MASFKTIDEALCFLQEMMGRNVTRDEARDFLKFCEQQEKLEKK